MVERAEHEPLSDAAPVAESAPDGPAGDAQTNAPTAGDAPADAPATAPAERVRVAWVVGPETFDRYARVLQPLAVGLMDEMVDLSVVCPPAPATQPPLGMPCEFVACPVRGWLGYGESSVERLGEFLRRAKVDLIHAADASAAELAHKVAVEQNLPYLVSCFAIADARRLGQPAADADLLLAASKPIADALATRIRPQDRIRLLRPGVYHVKHATCFQDPDTSVALVAGGPVENFHAFDAVLKCFAELAGRKFDCMFFVIGSGRAERKLRLQAHRLNLGGQITFIDALPTQQLARILQDADVYVTPAPQKSIDMHSLLAMAAGVPVLAAAGKNANDFLQPGQTAMGFTCGDPSELTAKLSALLEDRAGAAPWPRKPWSTSISITARPGMSRASRRCTAKYWQGGETAGKGSSRLPGMSDNSPFRKCRPEGPEVFGRGRQPPVCGPF